MESGNVFCDGLVDKEENEVGDVHLWSESSICWFDAYEKEYWHVHKVLIVFHLWYTQKITVLPFSTLFITAIHEHLFWPHTS